MKTQAEEITLAFSFRLDIFWLVSSHLLLVNINEGSAQEMRAGKDGNEGKGKCRFFFFSSFPAPHALLSFLTLVSRQERRLGTSPYVIRKFESKVK